MLSRPTHLPTKSDRESSWDQNRVWTHVWWSARTGGVRNDITMETMRFHHQDLILQQNGLHIQKEHVKMDKGMYWCLIILSFCIHFYNVNIKQHFWQNAILP